MEDYNKCTWIYSLKNKFDASTALQGFYNMIENHFETKIKIIRSDNGGEFNIQNFSLEKRVVRQMSCVEILFWRESDNTFLM